MIKNTNIVIKKNRLYVTAGGEKVRIYATDASDPDRVDDYRPIHGAIKSEYLGWTNWSWRIDGTWRGYRSKKYRVHTSDDWDIVGEWKS